MNEANTAWILVSTALVLLMTLPGLALFYAGLVSSKNTLSTLAQCFVIACLASIVWFICGYSIAFNGAGLFFGNLDKMFLSGVNISSMSGDIPETLFVMFQRTFAIITPALIVGAFVERIKFSAVIMITGIWLVLVYSPVTHWVWGGGWLAKMGVMDFAGGTVVHINAGVAALVLAVYLGNRNGFQSVPMPPHNLSMTVAGASMLWVGWFGFNAGSALAADQSAGMAMLVTHIGAASGSLAWMFREWTKVGKPSVLGIVTGMVAGLGTITPASGFVGPMGALVIGILAGLICYEATQYIKNKLRIDDSLDVCPVHGVGGILGTLLTAVFASSQFGGLGLENSISSQFMIQLFGVVFTIGWCAIFTIIAIKITEAFTGSIRVSNENEETGIDISDHGESSYN